MLPIYPHATTDAMEGLIWKRNQSGPNPMLSIDVGILEKIEKSRFTTFSVEELEFIIWGSQIPHDGNRTNVISITNTSNSYYTN
jgi:hypothetical protein